MIKPEPEYSRGERAALIALGVFGFAAVNGTFIYSLTFDRARSTRRSRIQ
jgi:hypothetical protein